MHAPLQRYVSMSRETHGDYVLIVNIWHDDNAGDSAIAQATIDLAKRKWPDVQLVALTMLGAADPAFPTWNRRLRRVCPDVQFGPAVFPLGSGHRNTGSFSRKARSGLSALRLLPAVRRLDVGARRLIGGATAVVVVGGSDLFALKVGRIGSYLRLRRLLEVPRIAGERGIPVHFWGHTLGPFATPAAQRLVGSVLDRACDVVVRDDASEALVNSLATNAQRRTRCLPDMAFALLPLPSDTAGAAPRSSTAVLVPRADLARPERTGNVVDRFVELARLLLNTGRVQFVDVQAQVLGPNDMEDDRELCAQIVSRCDDPRVRLAPPTSDVETLMEAYRRADAVISVRMHAAILAVMAGTPAFCINYFTSKTEGLYALLDEPDSWTTLDSFDPEMAVRWFDTRATEANRRQLSAKIDGLRERLAAV
jgi:polysaccharide pyruvyl transferase WcaK-like protein